MKVTGIARRVKDLGRRSELRGRFHEDYRKLGVRLRGKWNSNSHGARPVHLIITIITWILAGRFSIKKSRYVHEGDQDRAASRRTGDGAREVVLCDLSLSLSMVCKFKAKEVYEDFDSALF